MRLIGIILIPSFTTTFSCIMLDRTITITLSSLTMRDALCGWAMPRCPKLRLNSSRLQRRLQSDSNSFHWLLRGLRDRITTLRPRMDLRGRAFLSALLLA